MSSSSKIFFDLPMEVRFIIYHHTFQGAQITVEQEEHQPAHSPITHIYRNGSFRTELLRTCKQIRLEALPILAGKTTVILAPAIHDPNYACQTIPSIWLSQFRTIFNNTRIRSRCTHVLRQQYLDPTPFTSLQTFRIAHLVYPDWQDEQHQAEGVEAFVQKHLDSEFFFQAGMLRLFTQKRTYAITMKMWLLRAFVEESTGWELEFSLDSWTLLRKRRTRFYRRKNIIAVLWDDPKCRDHRNYHVEYLEKWIPVLHDGKVRTG